MEEATEKEVHWNVGRQDIDARIERKRGSETSTGRQEVKKKSEFPRETEI